MYGLAAFARGVVCCLGCAFCDRYCGDATTVYTMNATYLKSAVPMVVALLIIPAAIGMVYLWKSMKRT